MDADPDNLSLILLLSFPSLEIAFSLLLVVVLLICSALISGSEVAYFSLSPNELDKLKNENTTDANRILELLDKPRMLLATILISNNFINISMVILSTYILEKLFVDRYCFSLAENLVANLGINFISAIRLGGIFTFLVTIVGVTFLLVLFGEVAPKVYAKINNIGLAKGMSRTLKFLGKIFSPLSKQLVKGTSFIENRYSNRVQNGTKTSREDIDEAIELTFREGIDSDQDKDILKGIVKFGDVSVKQIMKARVDVVAIDFRIRYKELLRIVRKSGYSRMPVFDDDFDNITGMLYVKDLLPVLDEGNNYEWQVLIRPNIFYVPEAKKINDLLKEFQEKRMHMAIVVDEYGGSAGIVTLEDIMEEVIGEIRDEFDDEVELEYSKIDDFNYSFEGKTMLNDMCRVVGLDTTTFDDVKGDADSIAGLVLELVGQFPKKIYY